MLELGRQRPPQTLTTGSLTLQSCQENKSKTKQFVRNILVFNFLGTRFSDNLKLVCFLLVIDKETCRAENIWWILISYGT